MPWKSGLTKRYSGPTQAAEGTQRLAQEMLLASCRTRILISARLAQISDSIIPSGPPAETGSVACWPECGTRSFVNNPAAPR